MIAREALDSLVEFSRVSGASDEMATDASQLIVFGRRGRGDDVRAVWVSFCADNLLLGLWDVLRERDHSEVQRIDSLEGHYLLDDGDEVGAVAAADAMIRAAKTIDGDHWNEHDLLHRGHIVRGVVAMRHGDVEAAASELLAAGRAPDTSGRPDLELALALTLAGQDEAVLTYLRAVAPRWPIEPADEAST